MYLNPSDSLKVFHFSIRERECEAMFVMFLGRKHVKKEAHAAHVIAENVPFEAALGLD